MIARQRFGVAMAYAIAAESPTGRPPPVEAQGAVTSVVAWRAHARSPFGLKHFRVGFPHQTRQQRRMLVPFARGTLPTGPPPRAEATSPNSWPPTPSASANSTRFARCADTSGSAYPSNPLVVAYHSAIGRLGELKLKMLRAGVRWGTSVVRRWPCLSE